MKVTIKVPNDKWTEDALIQCACFGELRYA